MTKRVACSRTLVTVLFLCVVCVMGATASAGRKTASEAIPSINEKYMRYFSAGDAVALATLYAEDAVLLPPGNDLVAGRGSIAEYWERVLTSGATNILIEVIEIEESGDLAFETFRFTVTDLKKKEMGSGKNIVIWKHTKEGWRIYRDIWN